VRPETQEYDDPKPWLPKLNADGSSTIYEKGDIAVKIMPMTMTRTRGASNESSDQYTAEIERYAEVVKTDPRDYETCAALAAFYLNRGHPGDAELALTYVNRALAGMGNDPRLLLIRGLALAALGEDAEAVGDLETVITLNQQSQMSLYYVIGTIHYRAGNIEEAIKAFEKVHALDSDFMDIKSILAELNKYKS
jgi:tetratricopeptide (TPR) repeat protein